MRASDRLGLAVMAAMALSLPALSPVTSDGRLFVDCLLMIAVVGLGGIVTRRLLPTERGARAAQSLAAFVVLVLVGMSEGASVNPFTMSDVFTGAVRWTVESSAPMGPNLPVRLVAVAAMTLVAFIADQLTVSLLKPAWSLLPLGVIYLIPALALPALVSFWPVLWLGVGYLGVLLADAANRNHALGSRAAEGPRYSMLVGAAVSLLSALMVAGLAGVFTPGLDPSKGPPFTGQGPVQMGDPAIDLRRNLQQPVDRRVISYTTSRGVGAYLRMTSLPAFDEGGFHLNAIDLYSGPLPTPEGVPAGRSRYDIQVAVDDFNAEWLPLPYAPAAYRADGEWRHDPVSLSVLASGPQQKRATNRLSYSATVVDVSPTPGQVEAAAAGVPRNVEVTGRLPADFPSDLTELARQLTRQGRTDGHKAVLLQNWLRSSSFTYSTDPAPGSGYTALTQFLLGDRTGYCEQFAGAMAVLARAIGIPSRVAVGFLPGRKVGDHWEINIRDMHAWPELYLADLGWVGFEPTPGVAVAPTYTGPAVNQPSATPTPTPTPTPSRTVEQPSAEASAPAEPEQPADAGMDLSWLGWVGGALLVLVLAAAPALVRRARRLSRLRAAPAERAVRAAWDEVRDSVWDAGGEWPRGSARQIGDQVGKDLPAEAAAAMGRVAVLVERSRYAETIGDTSGLSGDVQRVRASVGGDAAKAWWRTAFPRSLWRGLGWRG